MLKILLAYNFTEERLKALRMAAMLVRSQVKIVETKNYNQTLGYLAGIKGAEAVEEDYTGEGFTREMLIICGFGKPDLDKLLVAIRKGALQNVSLKAVLTPINASWTGLKLVEELAQEHEYMQKNGKNLVHKK